jgi:putative peptide maturation dehydrogenase
MQVRRCGILAFESREALDFDVATLFSGEQALAVRLQWVGIAAHLDEEVRLDADDVALLSSLGETMWVDRAALDGRFGADRVDALLERGLLVSTEPAYAHWFRRDETVRATHWRNLPALAHFHGRWRAQAVGADPRLSQFANINEMVAEFGPPPPETRERCGAADRIALPAPAPGPLDGPMLGRYTGRNYDPAAVLGRDLVSRLLHRTFGAQAVREVAEGTVAYKKTSPSGGSLHPVEAYVLVQRVEGLKPGAYHYHPAAHALEPIRDIPAGQMRDTALDCVAGQDWFVDAPLLVMLVARFRRNFWKYRNHAKAYRALLLDAGHLSQSFYLLASEAGLPAFVTAAVNDLDIEALFGLDPMQEGVLAVCGCGPASGETRTVEFRLESA